MGLSSDDFRFVFEFRHQFRHVRDLAAARALIDFDSLDAEAIAKKAMGIAADLCIYTNRSILIERLPK